MNRIFSDQNSATLKKFKNYKLGYTAYTCIVALIRRKHTENILLLLHRNFRRKIQVRHEDQSPFSLSLSLLYDLLVKQ